MVTVIWFGNIRSRNVGVRREKSCQYPCQYHGTHLFLRNSASFLFLRMKTNTKIYSNRGIKIRCRGHKSFRKHIAEVIDSLDLAWFYTRQGRARIGFSSKCWSNRLFLNFQAFVFMHSIRVSYSKLFSCSWYNIDAQTCILPIWRYVIVIKCSHLFQYKDRF